MPWFYDSRTGAYAEEAGILGFLSNLQAKFGLGWHEYATYQDMTAAIAANHWPPLNNSPSNPVGKTVVGSAEAAAGSSGLGGLHLSWPGADTFLARSIKIILGGILLVAGILKLTGADKATLGIAGTVAGKLPGV
jgi:hypothetical protein